MIGQPVFNYHDIMVVDYHDIIRHIMAVDHHDIRHIMVVDHDIRHIIATTKIKIKVMKILFCFWTIFKLSE